MAATPTPISAGELAQEVLRAAKGVAAARTLLLDVDGTLAPIAPTPGEARVPDGTLDSIGKLVGSGWTIVLVSGRPVAEIRSMVPVEGVITFGCHGIEGGFTDGDENAPSVPDRLVGQIDKLESEIDDLSEGFPGVRVERKPAGLAFHDRLVPEDRLQDWRARLTRWLDRCDLDGFSRLEGKRVLELRPRDYDKGRVVRVVADRLGLSEADASFVALGDDVTDEDMFREILGMGLAVVVAESDRATLAARRIRSPEAAAEFLAALVSAATGT